MKELYTDFADNEILHWPKIHIGIVRSLTGKTISEEDRLY